jgi:hypothetical protein
MGMNSRNRGVGRARWWALAASAVLPVALSGCESMSNTDKGVLGGGALGAGIGALAAGPRHAGVGALAGGAIGAVVGGLSGSNADRHERRVEAANAAAVAAQQPSLSLEEIARLTSSGASDTLIINQVRVSGSVYYLTGEQVNWLIAQGVREPVIQEMQATAARQPRYVYAPRPVYVYPPPPPLGVGVVIGGR